MKHLLPVISLLALTACSGYELNEGQVRGGRATAPATTTSEGSPLSGALFLPDASSNDVLRVGDDVQITLVSAYICNFREAGGILNEPFGFATTNNQRQSDICVEDGQGSRFRGSATRGEIAILAGFQFNGVDGATSDVPGERVVYYNEDVRETGQLLNFLNLPLYGPAPYHLASARLRLSILELDQAEVEEQVAILNALADAGTTYASPVYGPTIGVLSSIGEALLRSNDDDVEFGFDMGFDAPNQASNLRRNLLREGYLAFIRRERRSDQNHFDDLHICPDRGVIAVGSCGPDESVSEPYYAGATWLLLRISKEDPAIADAALTRTVGEVVTARIAENLLSAPGSTVNQRISQALQAVREARERAKGETP
ncbi:MAG: hypothetical protein AAF577_11965 [Pseudomonadota bacterium]